MTTMIEAKENRDVAICDNTNSFILTQVESQDKDGHQKQS